MKRSVKRHACARRCDEEEAEKIASRPVVPAEQTDDGTDQPPGYVAASHRSPVVLGGQSKMVTG